MWWWIGAGAFLAAFIAYACVAGRREKARLAKMSADELKDDGWHVR